MALITSGDAEFGPKESFRLADGSIREEWTIIIRRMTIGSHVLTNVKASVAVNRPTRLRMVKPSSGIEPVGVLAMDVAFQRTLKAIKLVKQDDGVVVIRSQDLHARRGWDRSRCAVSSGNTS
jgi:hypothetical protein